LNSEKIAAMDKAEPDKLKTDQKLGDELIIARRKAAKRALLERVAKQPAMNIGKWTRDELYDC
jgi:hypothetical protein